MFVFEMFEPSLIMRLRSVCLRLFRACTRGNPDGKNLRLYHFSSPHVLPLVLIVG